MLFPNREFSWPRHVAIAVLLLTCINLLVIFAPNILGIFGIIGERPAGGHPPKNFSLQLHSGSGAHTHIHLFI